MLRKMCLTNHFSMLSWPSLKGKRRFLLSRKHPSRINGVGAELKGRRFLPFLISVRSREAWFGLASCWWRFKNNQTGSWSSLLESSIVGFSCASRQQTIMPIALLISQECVGKCSFGLPVYWLDHFPSAFEFAVCSSWEEELCNSTKQL